MPTVFVSHAGKDKPAIEPLVRALLLSKIPLFVDNPADERWSVSAEESSRFERQGLLDSIRTGRPYDDELKRGLSGAEVVLLCLSKHVSNLNPIIIAEISRAADEDRLVPVVVDDVAHDDLPAHLGLFRAQYAQSRRLETATVWTALQKRAGGTDLKDDEVEQLRQFEYVLKFIDDARSDAKAAGSSGPISEPSAGQTIEFETQTFRAGRVPQREDVDVAFDEVRNGGVRALIVSGPANELVDDFSEKIIACRRTRGLDDTRTHRIEARLPEPKRARTWEEFKREYGVKIAASLNMPANLASTEGEIARFVSELGAVASLPEPAVELERTARAARPDWFLAPLLARIG